MPVVDLGVLLLSSILCAKKRGKKKDSTDFKLQPMAYLPKPYEADMFNFCLLGFAAVERWSFFDNQVSMPTFAHLN